MIQSPRLTNRLPQILLCLLSVSTIALPVSKARGALPDKQPIVIAYIPGDHNTQMVTVKLNDSLTGTFVLSTGIVASGISPEFVTRLKLHPVQVKSPDGKSMKDGYDEVLKRVGLHKLQIGVLTLTDIRLVAPKADTLSAIVGRKIDGVIGTDILEKYAILFDFQQNRITLWSGGLLSKTQLKQYGLEKSYSAPILQLTEDFGYFAPIRVNGASNEMLLIDTGAAGTVLSLHTAHQLHLTSLGDLTADTVYGTVINHPAAVSKFTVGDFTAGATTLCFQSVGESVVPPLLGLDFMVQYHVLLDFPGEAMYFAPVERSSVIVPLGAKAFLDVPLMNVQLADGKIHLLGLNAGDVSALDAAVGAEWVGLVKTSNPPPPPGAKIVTSRVVSPADNVVIGMCQGF